MNYQTNIEESWNPVPLSGTDDSYSHEQYSHARKLKPNWEAKRLSISKRVLDLSIALSLLIILFPMLLFIYCAIRFKDNGPGLYRQKRIGRNEREFYCLKFRTMVVNADAILGQVLTNDPGAADEWARDHKLKQDPRVNKIGSFLRKTSLDELPQLWNILCGDMSLVGPRPIVKDEIRKYGPYFPAYASVLPGVTGLWQISGRNDTSYPERVQLDVEYANTQSMWKDLKILVLTIPTILFAHGAY